MSDNAPEGSCEHDPDNDPWVPIINVIDGSEGTVQECALCKEGYLILGEPLRYVIITGSLIEDDAGVADLFPLKKPTECR